MEALHSFLAAFDIFGMIFQYILNSFTRFGEIFERSFSFVTIPIGRLISSHPSFYYSLMMAGALFGLYYLVSAIFESRARSQKIRK
ncbi:MAG: hypothetical protein NTY96_06555 [Bacteroidetes bacterium]|nr:hypothetical protein [Bacteroidota bacterium]